MSGVRIIIIMSDDVVEDVLDDVVVDALDDVVEDVLDDVVVDVVDDVLEHVLDGVVAPCGRFARGAKTTRSTSASINGTEYTDQSSTATSKTMMYMTSTMMLYFVANTWR